MASEPFSKVKEEFMSQAKQAGFTKEQAEFMWQWLWRANA